MPKLSALLHTHNDGQRIGRAVESLRCCDEVLVVDHASSDDTVHHAREHGAKVKQAVPGVNPGVYAVDAAHDWILCLLPSESLSEMLEAALFEWKDREPDEFTNGFSLAVREENAAGWRDLGLQLRLVNRRRINWPDQLPGPAPATAAGAPPGVTLEGVILRFRHP